MRDVDLEAFYAVLQPTAVAEAARACERRFDEAAPDERDGLRVLLNDADAVLSDVGAAPLKLRDPASFFDPYAHHAARRCIRSALEIVSAATGGLVDYSIEPPHYDVRGADVMRLADLASATADPRTNLFEDCYQTVLGDLDRDRPDVVAVSILNLQQVIPGLTLARRLKERGHFVVIGGTVFTKFVGELLQRPQFFRLFCDGLIAYEGESALVELVAQLTNGRDFSQVPNFLYLDRHDRVSFTRYHVEDVSALPTPDYDGLPLDKYLTPSPVLPILTGKGCYFNRCKFCDIPFINHISRKAYRVRAPERVAADVAALHERHGARHFEITDEALAPKLLLRLADALADYPHVQPRFVGYARLEPGFTPDVCRQIYDMGVRKLFFGLESGSQATLDHMDKGIRVDNAPTVLRNVSEAGIAFHLFSIIGFPEETMESARETADFFVNNTALLDAPRNSFDIHPFTLDLRTSYAEQADTFGIEIDRDDLASRDFPLAAVRWTNTRGLDDARVDTLLDEFHEQLRATFRTYHQYPVTMWPGYEEYAVLYGDHYDGQPFEYRFNLPPDGDTTPISLIWTEQARFKRLEDGYAVSGPFGAVRASETALALLARPRAPLPVSDLLPLLGEPLLDHGAHVHELTTQLRAVIDQLLGTGSLRVTTPALEPAIR